MAKVRPLRDRVLVKRIEEQEQKVGGIIVPDTAKEKPQQAEVVAVGSGRVLENGQREPLAVKAGDKVGKDLVWSYPSPIPECPKITGLMCFFNERVEAIYVDGELQPKPQTRWSLPSD